MPTWTKPQSITNATKINEADDILEYNLKNLQAYVNGVDDGETVPAYSSLTGLTADMVDRLTAQSIDGLKTFLVPVAADITGNAATSSQATVLATSRTISLLGDALGSVSFDGSSNVSITVDVQNDSHTHDFANLTLKPTTVAGYGITDAVQEGDSVTLTGDVGGTAVFDVNGNVAIDTTLNVTASPEWTQFSISMSYDGGSGQFNTGFGVYKTDGVWTTIKGRTNYINKTFTGYKEILFNLPVPCLAQSTNLSILGGSEEGQSITYRSLASHISLSTTQITLVSNNSLTSSANIYFDITYPS